MPYMAQDSVMSEAKAQKPRCKGKKMKKDVSRSKAE